MCSRGELKQLLHELLFRMDQVAYLGARTQFNEECNTNAHKYSEKIQTEHGNIRFENILRFQKAYMRYFVFASDPYTEFIVPLTSSSLALFITNILSRDGPTSSSTTYYHTSRSIIEFLQITQSHVVETLLLHYKTDLTKLLKELRLPYNIDVLTQIRRECYHQHFSDPNSLQNSQVLQIAQDAQQIFYQHIPKSKHYQPHEHTPIKQEEYILQLPYPYQGTNISVMQNGMPDQIVNYAPIVHTIPNDGDGYIYDVDSTPLLILTPVTSVNNTQPTPNENPNSSFVPVIEIPLQNEVTNEKMTMDMSKTDSINNVTSTASNTSQISNHQLCAGCGKPIQDRYLLKALDMLWHEDCLKCGCCDCRLGEVGSTLYTKGNLMLCKRDYLRLFGNTGMCAACNKVIPAFEMVMRARNNVYHLECFACQQCNHRFCVGDRFYLCENKILCEYDYEERLVFASIGNHPMLKRHANTVAQNPPPPPYTKTGAGNMANGNGPIGSNGVSPMQQQVMGMEQTQSSHQHQHQQHIQQSKMQHDDHNNNNNNNNNHGPSNGGSCGIAANQFNTPLMKIPHSA